VHRDLDPYCDSVATIFMECRTCALKICIHCFEQSLAQTGVSRSDLLLILLPLSDSLFLYFFIILVISIFTVSVYFIVNSIISCDAPRA